MNYERAKAYLSKRGQQHLLDYYDELSATDKETLLNDIENTNFSVLAHVGQKPKKLGKITPVNAVTSSDIKRRYSQFESVGLDFLSEGKVAAVLLAGGQGSRLGFKGPKGMFNIGVNRFLSIFEQQMNNIAEVNAKTGRHFHLFIMTSRANNDETIKFFKENDYFGYPRDRIHFYIQDVAPTCDYSGKVFLDEKHRVSLAPNGNGGWYSSLVNSGLARIMERDGIEWLNVYSVDNVLQRICDPAFIGATIIKRCGCGAKVVKKVCADEKVGVLCNEDGKPAIMEYYEMPEDLKNKTKKGELVYCYGVTLNYLFNVHELNSTLSGRLPYHVADKAIPHIENGVRVTPEKPCGYKLETLVVDMVKMMGSCLAYEVERDREFAPVKNATGTDSVETARALLEQNGVIL
ncbi:MAG: UDPGP type 1 family protein [Clostridia bacterium]|jgi:UDP-N-acetylglucosamine/UDP-N-acetylgalactosamine diphosphorylase|nr:UDPGP type 1 family protein [Clostridia bacterium]